MEKKVQELKSRLMEITDINLAAALLAWDQATYMPSGGAAARGRQMAALGRIGHEKLIDPKMGKLLDDLQTFGESLPYDNDDASIIRVAKKVYDRAAKVPADLMGQMQEHSAAAYQVW
ncbi:MAG: carboxypeptidase M32, partial [Chloroflexi bacterium]